MGIPQLIVYALLAYLGYFIWKRLKIELKKLDQEELENASEQAHVKKQEAEKSTELKQDPKTGVYRVDDD